MIVFEICFVAFLIEKGLKYAQKRQNEKIVYVSSYSIDSEIQYHVNEISQLKSELNYLESQLNNKKHPYIDIIENVNPQQIKCLKNEIQRHRFELEKLTN